MGGQPPTQGCALAIDDACAREVAELKRLGVFACDLEEAEGMTAQQLKDALVLALVSKEHVYVEGPPGAAKTLLAEPLARKRHVGGGMRRLHRGE